MQIKKSFLSLHTPSTTLLLLKVRSPGQPSSAMHTMPSPHSSFLVHFLSAFGSGRHCPFLHPCGQNMSAHLSMGRMQEWPQPFEQQMRPSSQGFCGPHISAHTPKSKSKEEEEDEEGRKGRKGGRGGGGGRRGRERGRGGREEGEEEEEDEEGKEEEEEGRKGRRRRRRKGGGKRRGKSARHELVCFCGQEQPTRAVVQTGGLTKSGGFRAERICKQQSKQGASE